MYQPVLGPVMHMIDENTPNIIVKDTVLPYDIEGKSFRNNVIQMISNKCMMIC